MLSPVSKGLQISTFDIALPRGESKLDDAMKLTKEAAELCISFPTSENIDGFLDAAQNLERLNNSGSSKTVEQKITGYINDLLDQVCLNMKCSPQVVASLLGMSEMNLEGSRLLESQNKGSATHRLSSQEDNVKEADAVEEESSFVPDKVRLAMWLFSKAGVRDRAFAENVKIGTEQRPYTMLIGKSFVDMTGHVLVFVSNDKGNATYIMHITDDQLKELLTNGVSRKNNLEKRYGAARILGYHLNGTDENSREEGNIDEDVRAKIIEENKIWRSSFETSLISRFENVDYGNPRKVKLDLNQFAKRSGVADYRDLSTGSVSAECSNGQFMTLSTYLKHNQKSGENPKDVLARLKALADQA